MVTQSAQDYCGDLLRQLLTDWQAAESISGSVVEGLVEKAGAIPAANALILYVSNLDDYPQEEEIPGGALLVVGYLITWRFSETGVATAEKAQVDFTESIIKYIQLKLRSSVTISSVVKRLPFFKADFKSSFDKNPESAFYNAQKIEVVFLTDCLTRS
jgi:hypothetical protein